MDWKLFWKILTGIIIVPLSIAVGLLWSWWEKAPLGWKILTGPIVIPLTLIMYGLTPWWADL
jgi:hypothetical protein